MLDRTRNWKTISIGFLFATICLGVLLRAQFSGLTSFGISFDIRRAHSHLGFYGFLFPFIWSRARLSGMWAPTGLLSWGYVCVVLIATVSFALQGYGTVSRASSGLVMLVWIVFSLKNWTKFPLLKRCWLSAIPFGVLMASACVALVAFYASQGHIELSQQYVRAFLACLTFGVFVPFALWSCQFTAPSALLWCAATMGNAIFLAEIFPKDLFLWGPLAIAYFIFSACRHLLRFDAAKLRLFFYWILLSLSCFGLAFSVLPNSRLIVVAGMHFVILGPLIASFIHFQNVTLRILYDISVSIMILCLVLMEVIPTWYLVLQRGAAITGAAILLCVFLNRAAVETSCFKKYS